MPSPSTPPPPSSQGSTASPDAVASAGAGSRDPADPRSLDTPELLEKLRQDRLWLLRQLDAGLWPTWRLDLAALERELGQLLEQAEDRLGQG